MREDAGSAPGKNKANLGGKARGSRDGVVSPGPLAPRSWGLIPHPEGAPRQTKPVLSGLRESGVVCGQYARLTRARSRV
jgi:hypothetical protein